MSKPRRLIEIGSSDDCNAWMRSYLAIVNSALEFDVSRFRYQELDIFPILRTSVLAELALVYLARRWPVPKVITGNLLRLVRYGQRARSMALATLNWNSNEQISFSTPPKKGENWYLSNSSGITHYRSFHYDRFMLPMLATNQTSCNRLIYVNLKPHQLPKEMLTAPLIETWPLRRLMRQACLKNYVVWNQDIRNWLGFVRSQLPKGVGFNQKLLQASIEYALIVYRQMDQLFETQAPRRIYLVNYYSDFGYGLIAAARKHNIPCIDVQHGVQGPWHYAYYWPHFKTLPNTLPNQFRVWSEAEVKSLNSWGQGLGVLASVGGSPQEQFAVASPIWSNPNELGMEPEGEDQLRARITSTDTNRQVLVTLEPAHMVGWVKDFLQMARKHKVGVWLRLHPRIRRRPRWIRNLAWELNLDLACRTPLPILLKHMDFHITNYSSVILDAQAAGVPSITLSRHAAVFFEYSAPSLSFVESLDQLFDRLIGLNAGC